MPSRGDGRRKDWIMSSVVLNWEKDEHLVTEREEAGEEVVVIDGFLENHPSAHRQQTRALSSLMFG